jgi:dienelactone hydrolase
LSRLKKEEYCDIINEGTSRNSITEALCGTSKILRGEPIGMKTEYAKYKDGSIDLTGMFAWQDSSAAKRPGILVVPAVTGLDDHPKGRARQFAEWGYVAFACDMFGANVPGDREGRMNFIRELRSDLVRLRRRAAAGVDVLRDHPLCDGRIAAVGYCFGGLTVLELARSGADFAGVVSLHGTLGTPNPAQPGRIKAKVLACSGAIDPHVPMTQITAFVEEMNASGADWQMAVYGGAKHGFAHEDGPNFPSVEYHALSDFRSTHLIRDFFTELFGEPAVK